MNGIMGFGVNGTSFIDRFSNDIHNSSKSFGSDGDHNWATSVSDCLSSDKSVSGIKSNGSDSGVSKMLGNFENKSIGGSFDFQSIKNGGKSIFELDIDDGSNNLGNLSFSGGLSGGGGAESGSVQSSFA